MKLKVEAFLHDEVIKIVRAVSERGGRALCVGGCVRDSIYGVEAKDIDVEVFGVDALLLEELLSDHFTVLKVGKAFGVFKLKGLPIDVSLPRKERKVGEGHADFVIHADPYLSPLEAAKRRDFTFNAISLDPLTGEVVDPLGGEKDCRNRILRHCSDKFSEDALRVLRAMQLIARFDLKVDPSTLELCRSILPGELSQERIFEEWCKLLLKGVKISRGLTFLKDSGWIKYYPELEALIGCEQSKEWHPEGDVWTHTLHCLDGFAEDRMGEPWEDLVVGFAVLCHDMGKPATTVHGEDGKISSIKHDVVGVPIAERFLRRMSAQHALFDEVLPLVETHMRPIELFRSQAGDSAIRRLAQKVGRIDRLMRVFKADMKGRPPLPYEEFYPTEKYIMEKAEALSVKDSQPKPLVLGRDLIAEGLVPGIEFKAILDICFEAQLDGKFTEEEGAKAFLRQYLAKNIKKS